MYERKFQQFFKYDTVHKSNSLNEKLFHIHFGVEEIFQQEGMIYQLLSNHTVADVCKDCGVSFYTLQRYDDNFSVLGQFKSI